MDQRLCVRISISYYSLTRKGSPRIYDRVYVRLGRLVVSMYSVQGERLLRTVQDMLTILPVFLLYINKFLFSDPSDALVLNSRFRFLKAILPELKNLSLFSKREFLCSVTERSQCFLVPGRLSVPFTRGLPTMITLLLKRYFELLEVYQNLLTSKEETA